MRKIVIFDFDGTIVKSMDLALKLYNELARKYKTRVFSDDDVQTFKQLSTAERFKFVGAPIYLIPLMIYAFKKNYKRHVGSLGGVEGMKALIMELKTRGVPLAILSSNSRSNIMTYLHRTGLEVFDHVISSRGIGGKYRTLRKMARMLKLDTQNMVYIGDEILDIEACRKAGVRMIAVTWGFESAEHLAAQHPDFLVNQPDEIIPIVSG